MRKFVCSTNSLWELWQRLKSIKSSESVSESEWVGTLKDFVLFSHFSWLYPSVSFCKIFESEISSQSNISNWWYWGSESCARGEGGNEKLRWVCFENEYQECWDQWAGCYFSKVACQTYSWSGCLHLRLLNITNQPIRAQIHVASSNQRSRFTWFTWSHVWMLTLGGYGGVRCDDNIDCEHITSSALIGQLSASLASDWLISVPLSWQPRMHTWAPHCYGARCHLQPNRNNTSDPGNIKLTHSLICRQFPSESPTIKDNQCIKGKFSF